MAQNVSKMSWLEGVACRPDPTCLGIGEQGSAGAVVSNWFSDVSCIRAGECGLVGTAGGIPPLPVWAWKG